jgi:hypothetical protein
MRLGTAFAIAVVGIGVAVLTAGCGGSKQSALTTSPFKRYTIEEGVSIGLPRDWTVAKNRGSAKLSVLDKHHAPKLVEFWVNSAPLSVSDLDSPLVYWAGTAVQQLRRKIGDDLRFSSRQIVKLPVGRAFKFVYTVKGTEEHVTYGLVRNRRLYALNFAASSISLAHSHLAQFDRSARSLRIAG